MSKRANLSSRRLSDAALERRFWQQEQSELVHRLNWGWCAMIRQEGPPCGGYSTWTHDRAQAIREAMRNAGLDK